MNESAAGLELRDSAPPEALLPDHGLWPWWLGAAVLVMLLAAALVFKRRKPAVFDAEKAREEACREARAALADTRAADARAAAVQCSLVLRKYLSAAAADPALYETHEEFILRHNALNALTEEARAAAESGFSRLAALKYGPEIPATPAAEVIAESRALLETLHHGFAK